MADVRYTSGCFCGAVQVEVERRARRAGFLPLQLVPRLDRCADPRRDALADAEQVNVAKAPTSSQSSRRPRRAIGISAPPAEVRC